MQILKNGGDCIFCLSANGNDHMDILTGLNKLVCNIIEFYHYRWALSMFSLWGNVFTPSQVTMCIYLCVWNREWDVQVRWKWYQVITGTGTRRKWEGGGVAWLTSLIPFLLSVQFVFPHLHCFNIVVVICLIICIRPEAKPVNNAALQQYLIFITFVQDSTSEVWTLQLKQETLFNAQPKVGPNPSLPDC